MLKGTSPEEKVRIAETLHQIDERRYAEASETLTRMLAVKPDLATAHGKLGTLYAIAGQSELAAKHLADRYREDG